MGIHSRKEFQMKKKMVNEMKLSFVSDSKNESFSRYAVTAFVSQLDPAIDELADVRTSVSEAVTNSIIHGYRGISGRIYLEVALFDDRSIRIRIKD